MHSIHHPELAAEGDEVTIEGDEAAHATRVKRLNPGEMVRLFDGRGLAAIAEVIDARRALRVRVRERRTLPPDAPAVHVWSATPKGPRIAELVEGLVQVGAASWTPMQTKLGVVDPRESKLERMERIVVEASKQSLRAWLLTIEEKQTLAQACAAAPDTAIIMADAGGSDYRATGARAVRLLIGPEGGWTKEERAAAEAAGVRIVRFGPHVMRIETAAAVAAAMAMHEERRSD